ncbi:MAG TPA: hypothetical protein VH062_00145 [Polyangiaceae bacterium]|nr:hypothetical protein [Polyangiaceae bacterium]
MDVKSFRRLLKDTPRRTRLDRYRPLYPVLALVFGATLLLVEGGKHLSRGEVALRVALVAAWAATMFVLELRQRRRAQ